MNRFFALAFLAACSADASRSIDYDSGTSSSATQDAGKTDGATSSVSSSSQSSGTSSIASSVSSSSRSSASSSRSSVSSSSSSSAAAFKCNAGNSTTVNRVDTQFAIGVQSIIGSCTAFEFYSSSTNGPLRIENDNGIGITIQAIDAFGVVHSDVVLKPHEVATIGASVWTGSGIAYFYMSAVDLSWQPGTTMSDYKAFWINVYGSVNI